MKLRSVFSGLAVLSGLLSTLTAPAQLMISGNENKIELTSGTAVVIPNAAPDNLSILDFSSFPPRVTQIDNVTNTVIGPPSNIAITPDGRTAFVASSVKPDPADPSRYVPNDVLYRIDLSKNPPQVAGSLAGPNFNQPSGMSFTPDGRTLLIANRAGGTISLFQFDWVKNVTAGFAPFKVCEPADCVSDVAISPDGKTALASIQKQGVLAELQIDGASVKPTGRKFSVYGQPYRVIITPDGEFAVTPGAGYSTNGIDLDAVSVVDLKADPPRAVQHLTTGSGPESVEISPDGELLAVVTMDGSNLGPGNPNRTDAGGLYLYRRTKHGFDFSQHLKTGRIPEGVAFTSDGKYLVVQCHPDRELRIYRVRGGKVTDTGERVKVPGMPSSLRAAR